jgi:hypothetical protein
MCARMSVVVCLPRHMVSTLPHQSLFPVRQQVIKVIVRPSYHLCALPSPADEVVARTHRCIHLAYSTIRLTVGTEGLGQQRLRRETAARTLQVLCSSGA